MKDYGNPLVTALPARLRRFVVDQHYSKYTAVDQAVWRYVMRQNWYYLKDAAYYPYIEGLKRAGLSIATIPNLQQMNDSLAGLGWGAVTVDGFIPPAAFMEFQSLRVLVIASDIRQLKNIEYTPAPDIIHESAGHAPIIADPGYARYLAYFGEIGTKAISSRADFELYEAVRRLSILKEMPNEPANEIMAMEAEVKERQDNLGSPSEMALLSRLHWWTVEYGLIGTPANPKIYGAGLLSSIGESVNCMKEHVKKLPYDLSTINYPFDITSQQPQLFVTPDFDNLLEVLEQFAGGMAFRKGGPESLQKAVESGQTCTFVLDTDLQISGVLKSFIARDDQVCFLDFAPPVALAWNNREISNAGRSNFEQGLKLPLGLWSATPAVFAVREDLLLEYESGYTVNGTCTDIQFENGAPVAVELSRATVRVPEDGKPVLYSERCFFPLGKIITSVFNGAADKEAFEDFPPMPSSQTWHPVYTENELRVQRLYARVRELREENLGVDVLAAVLPDLWRQAVGQTGDLKDTWLCALEIAEIIKQISAHHPIGDGTQEHLNALAGIAIRIEDSLRQFAAQNPGYAKLVDDGLKLADYTPGEAMLTHARLAIH